MNPKIDSRAAPPYTVRIDPGALRHAMRVRGLTGAELARRAGVSPATISHAMNGRRINPGTLRAINAALRAIPPLDQVEALVACDGVVLVPANGRWTSPA